MLCSLLKKHCETSFGRREIVNNSDKISTQRIEKSNDINGAGGSQPRRLVEQTEFFSEDRQVAPAVLATRIDLWIHAFRVIRNERRITTCTDHFSKSSVIAGAAKHEHTTSKSAGNHERISHGNARHSGGNWRLGSQSDQYDKSQHGRAVMG